MKMKMKRILAAFLLLLAVVTVDGLALSAQERPVPAFDRILQEPQYAYLEYYLYKAPIEPAAKPPKGYKPVYISHYGRHGARYNYKQEGYDDLKAFFEKAVGAGVLTAEGKALAQKYLDAYKYFDGRAGDLTPIGWEEHYGIGLRMYRNYRQVFRKHPDLDARASTIQRSIMSMVACCDALEEQDSRIRIAKETSESLMAIMNPPHSTHPFSELIRSGEKPYGKSWRNEVREMKARDIRADEYLPRFFTDLDWVEANFGKTNLELELYFLMISTACTDVPVSFEGLFSPEELCGLWEWRNYLYYQHWGPGENGTNPAFLISSVLLDDIMDRADEDLASGRLGARLRFGHDTPIAMILCLMGVDGWATPVAHPSDIKYVYDFTNVPMGANLQWVFYRNCKGDTLVRMMLNERDLPLPLPGDMAPYYRWSDFTSHYRSVTSAARARMADMLK